MPVSSRALISQGQLVKVVQKHHQSSGQLTLGVVDEILTSSSFHPRGIKVRLSNGLVGRVQELAKPHEEESVVEVPSSISSSMVYSCDIHEKPHNRRRQKSKVIVEKEWTCSACTFANSAALKRCEICDTPLG